MTLQSLSITCLFLFFIEARNLWFILTWWLFSWDREAAAEKKMMIGKLLGSHTFVLIKITLYSSVIESTCKSMWYSIIMLHDSIQCVNKIHSTINYVGFKRDIKWVPGQNQVALAVMWSLLIAELYDCTTWCRWISDNIYVAIMKYLQFGETITYQYNLSRCFFFDKSCIECADPEQF